MERSFRQAQEVLTYFAHYEYGFHQKTQGGSSQEEVPEKLAVATDDVWVIDEADMELIRVHKQMRIAKYEPIPAKTRDPARGKKGSPEDLKSSQQRF